MSTFVILEHDTTPADAAADAPRAVHWDFIVTAPGAERLPTWRLAADPRRATGAIAAERIADHRDVYLTYEGPISGDRGVVRRVERGTVEIVTLDGDTLRANLKGEALRGECVIRPDESGSLVFEVTRAAV
jgi:hypothetical protein